MIHKGLHQELIGKGFVVEPGTVDENISTEGTDLLNLPKETILSIGNGAKIEITGLRNPCKQLDHDQNGLLGAVLDRTEDGEIVRKAEIMGVILSGGSIRAGDTIIVDLPTEPHQQLERV